MVGRFLLYLAVFTASYAVKAELYVFPAQFVKVKASKAISIVFIIYLFTPSL